ncbi:MAG: hypothetical protein KDD62_09945 [Bdellovibrionales bacterium]|nr:hypothetical protein [Bdellovibrionales bacterium]
MTRKVPNMLAWLILGLSCLQPVANFAHKNTINHDINYLRCLAYFLTLFVITSICLFLWKTLNRRSSFISAALFIGIFTICLTSDYLIFNHGVQLLNFFGLRARIFYPIELGGFLLLAYLGSTLIARSKDLLLAFFAALFTFTTWDAVQVLLIAKETHRPSIVRTSSDNGVHTPGQIKSKITPNVYFILPDSHVGKDVFPYLKIPPTIFSNLQARDFQIINQAVTNATVTTYSMAHLLSMQLIFDGLTKVTHSTVGDTSLAETTVFKEFRKRNYSFVHFYDGYDGPQCPEGTDVCVSASHFLTKQDVQFLARTPLLRLALKSPLVVGDVPLSLYLYPNRLEIPDMIPRLPEASSGPFFAFFHFSLPHPPYRYAKDCSYQTFRYGIDAYRDQIQCAATLLTSLVDGIIEKDPGAIIIVQADTGDIFPGAPDEPTILGWPESTIPKRVSILSAFRGPDSCLTYLKPGLSPVNTFRWVFACLDQKPPEYLPDRTWIVRYLGDVGDGTLLEWPQVNKAAQASRD